MILEFDPYNILQTRNEIHDAFISIIEDFIEDKEISIKAGVKAYEILSSFPSFYPDKESPNLNISFVTAYIHPLFGKENTYNIIIEIPKSKNAIVLITLKPTE